VPLELEVLHRGREVLRQEGRVRELVDGGEESFSHERTCPVVRHPDDIGGLIRQRCSGEVRLFRAERVSLDVYSDPGISGLESCEALVERTELRL